MELLRNGLDKRALKLAKKRLGGHKRGLRKRNEMADQIKKIRIAAQKEKEEREKAEKAEKVEK